MKSIIKIILIASFSIASHADNAVSSLSTEELESIKATLVRVWEGNFKVEGVRDFSGGETKVFTHPGYPKFIFKTSSDEELRAKANTTHNMARLVKELGFHKVVVPESILVEVNSSLLGKQALFLIEEKFDVPMEKFESEYFYGDFYKRFECEPDLKRHFHVMFLELVELSARLPGLWDAKHNNLPLEKHVDYPRMVLVDVQEGWINKSRDERVEYLFKGSKGGAVAHADFFDDMYAKAKEIIPSYGLGFWFDKWKKAKEEDLQTTLAFRHYLEENRSSPDADIPLEVLETLGFSDDELETARFWVKRLNGRIAEQKKHDHAEFTPFSAPILRKYSYGSFFSCEDDKVLEKLRDNRVIFSLERVAYEDGGCTYTFRW